MFMPIYRQFTGILVYRDLRIVGVIFSMALTSMIIKNMFSNIEGNSRCRNAIEKTQFFIVESLQDL